MIKPTLEQIKSVIAKKGYKWFTDKVNIGGIRTNDKTPDAWNDWIYIEFKGLFFICQGTTEPGVYWLQHPQRESGAFVMVPGQHIDIWEKGLHHGYPALVQARPIPGYRDADKDNLIDPDKTKIYMDGAGVNCHHGHEFVKQIVVDKYSAGCQVVCAYADWVTFFEIYSESIQKYFSYTLLEENDFNLAA